MLREYRKHDENCWRNGRGGLLMEDKDTLQNSWSYQTRKIIYSKGDENQTTEIFYTNKNNVVDYYYYIHNNKENTYAISNICSVYDKYGYNWWENIYRYCKTELTDDFIKETAQKEAEKYFDVSRSVGGIRLVGDVAMEVAQKSFIDSLTARGDWCRRLYTQNKDQWNKIGNPKAHTIGWGYDSLYNKWYELEAIECVDGLIFNAVDIDRGNRIGYENIGAIIIPDWESIMDNCVDSNCYVYSIWGEEQRARTTEEYVKDIVDLEMDYADIQLVFPVYVDERERQNVKKWYRQFLYKQGLSELHKLEAERERNAEKEEQKTSGEGDS